MGNRLVDKSKTFNNVDVSKLYVCRRLEDLRQLSTGNCTPLLPLKSWEGTNYPQRTFTLHHNEHIGVKSRDFVVLVPLARYAILLRPRKAGGWTLVKQLARSNILSYVSRACTAEEFESLRQEFFIY